MNNIAAKEANYFYSTNKLFYENSNKTGKWLTALIKTEEDCQHNNNLYKHKEWGMSNGDEISSEYWEPIEL